MNNRNKIQTECLNTIIKHYRCTAAVSMGVGKTRIALMHLHNFYKPGMKALVVVPKLSIINSWAEEIEKTELYHLTECINYSTYRSINKQENIYDIVYLDECHNILGTHIPFLSGHKGRILGLTGTPPWDERTDKYRLIDIYCPVKYKFDVDKATDSNILNDYRIIIHEINLSKSKNLKKKTRDGRQWYTSEVKDYEYVNKRFNEARPGKDQQIAAIMRMKALQSYTSKEFYAKDLLSNISDKCIVFANTHEQADKMCNHSYHSSNPKSEENLQLFSDGRIDKLSCVLQLSEGVTIPNLKQGIIMHAYGNERKSAQRIGRLLRLNPTETSICHILCYKGTKDEQWVKSALHDFDQNKIEYYNPLEI